MFKVVSIVDKENSAIWRLAKMLEPYHQNFQYVVVDCHPKRPSPQQLQRIEQECRTADVIDAQYYKTADMLRERYSWLRDIPTVLTHHNPYSIHERDWNDYQVVIANNKTIHADLQKITSSRTEMIHNAVDPYFWKFNEDYKNNKSVLMVANRIESKKGILPVALACKKLGIRMDLVGSISSPDYFQEIIQTGVVHFSQEITDEQLRELYYKAGVHVCNSIDNFESGTMPILEAMFCGVPVITRRIGVVPDLKSSTMVINEHQPEDVEHLADLIQKTLYFPLEDKKVSNYKTVESKLQDLRNEAWYEIKYMNPEIRAYKYQRLYRELLPQEPVSVILPVADKPEVTRKNLIALDSQTYKNIEIIVIDDGSISQKDNIDSFANTVSMPVRYIRLGDDGYNLAKARNLAAIEATSEILVFVDQRIILEPDCIQQFVDNLLQNTWLYGDKGAKKDFIENLSCIFRTDFMRCGMFNERIDSYGGMSQEIRWRCRQQGMNLQYLESAKATPHGKSSNRRQRKYEIMRMKNLCFKIGAN